MDIARPTSVLAREHGKSLTETPMPVPDVVGRAKSYNIHFIMKNLALSVIAVLFTISVSAQPFDEGQLLEISYEVIIETENPGRGNGMYLSFHEAFSKLSPSQFNSQNIKRIPYRVVDYSNRFANQIVSFQIGKDAPDYLLMTATSPYGYPVKSPLGGWIWDITVTAKRKYRMKDGSISESIATSIGRWTGGTGTTPVSFNIDIAGAPDVDYSLSFFNEQIIDLKSLRNLRTGFDHGIVGTLEAKLVPVNENPSAPKKLRVEFERYDDSEKTVGFSSNVNGPYLKSPIPEIVKDLNNGKVAVIVEDEKSTVDSNVRFSSPVD